MQRSTQHLFRVKAFRVDAERSNGIGLVGCEYSYVFSWKNDQKKVTV
jgi:hypothetical protein